MLEQLLEAYEKQKGVGVLWEIEDLMHIFKVSERTIIRYYQESDLKVVKLGNCIRFTPDAVRAFILAHEGLWAKQEALSA